jgi:hypothetical protein
MIEKWFPMYSEEEHILSLIMAWKKPNEDKFFVRGVTQRTVRVTNQTWFFSANDDYSQ